MRLDFGTLRRVLLVRLDNIGDIIMLTPSLRALRAAMPRAELTLMASPSGALAAPLLPCIDDVLIHRALWQDAHKALSFAPERESAFIGQLREKRFDAAIIFTSFSQTPYAAAYAAYLAGIPIRAAQAHDFGGGVLSHPVSCLDRPGHQVDRNLHLIAALGLECERRDMELVVPEPARDRATARLRTNGIGSPYIVLAPGASCGARRYPAERYAKAVPLLVETLGMPVVALGTERDREQARELKSLHHPRFVPLFGETDLAESAAIIAGAALVICNNSAPMHIADAFRRPLVVAYSGSDLESQWRPRRSPSRILRRSTACTPCYRFECRYRLECLDFAPDEIVENARSLLADKRTEHVRVA